MEDYLLAPARQFSAWHRGVEGGIPVWAFYVSRR